MKTVLLTGATGFLGSHLLEALLKNDYRVVILKRSTSDTWRIKHLLDSVKNYNVDIQNLELAFLEQRIDMVIHTACNYGRKGESISQVVDTNLIFGLNLLDVCLKFNTDTFLNTDTLLQNNINIYTLSKKQLVEWLCQASNKIQVVNLRLEHIYGLKDDSNKFVPWILGQLKEVAIEIKLTSGEQKRDFIYIDDVVSAYLIALNNLNKLPKFSEFDVGTGKLITVKSFIKQLKNAYEAKYGESKTNLNFGAIPLRKGEMMTIDVNNLELINLGWEIKITLKKGLMNIIESSI